MQYQSLSPDFAVAGQLSPDDMAAVKAAGFRSVIINRPDAEGGADQPTAQAVMAAAQANGLQIVYQPVTAGQINAADVAQFSQHFESLPKPVLAYCRTGTRCTILFQSIQQAV